MPRRDRLKDYRVPRTGGLRRRLLWRLRRMRHAVLLVLGEICVSAGRTARARTKGVH